MVFVPNVISKLAESKQSADRIQHLVFPIKSSPQAFRSAQVIVLVPYFPGNELLLLILHVLDSHLFGLRCDQAAQLLQMISVLDECLEALQVIDDNLLDPSNHFQFRNIVSLDLLPQVDQIMADTCGQHFNRLQYIVHDLHKLLHHRVQPQFKFNIIHFNTDVHHWKNSLTLVTSEHLKQAKHYLDHLKIDGQTNTYDALKLALTMEVCVLLSEKVAHVRVK
ncbi:unnamed protein product [Rotaria sp. Silwood2]|nr:unnamed protein product [Rotaria sp. Silwood2]